MLEPIDIPDSNYRAYVRRRLTVGQCEDMILVNETWVMPSPENVQSMRELQATIAIGIERFEHRTDDGTVSTSDEDWPPILDTSDLTPFLKRVQYVRNNLDMREVGQFYREVQSRLRIDEIAGNELGESSDTETP